MSGNNKYEKSSKCQRSQRLAGRLASLARFLPKSADKARPFFKLLRKPQSFKWDEECEQAFEEFKNFLASPPVLTRPKPGKELLLYLSVTESAISEVVVQEEDKQQMPVYFISRVLKDTETRYQVIEKLAYALVTTARRLRAYFQSSGKNRPPDQTSITEACISWKNDWMVDWIIWIWDIIWVKRSDESSIPLWFCSWVILGTRIQIELVGFIWNTQGSGAGAILEGPGDLILEQSFKFGFKASNNQAEYEALIAGLILAKEVGAKAVKCKSDPQLVIAQIKGDYQAKDPLLTKYLCKVNALISEFKEFIIEHISREENARVDLLSKLASTKKVGHHRTIIQETLSEPSIYEAEIMQIEPVDRERMSLIWEYLVHDTLPVDKK